MSREPEPPTATDHAFDFAEDIFERTRSAFSFTANYLQLENKLVAGKHFASDHPLFTLFFIIACAMCAIPVLCFLAFAIGSICVMFTGFMFFEGIMLTFGLFILLGIIVILAFFALGASVIIGVTGYIYVFLRNLLNQFINGQEEVKPVDHRKRHVHIGSHQE